MYGRTLVVSIVAGLIGGAFSGYLRPTSVQAQSLAPKEIRAQRFTLVNQDGIALGSFAFDNDGRPKIILRDRSGHELWSTGERAGESSKHLDNK
jgi:hypothetical protein